MKSPVKTASFLALALVLTFFGIHRIQTANTAVGFTSAHAFSSSSGSPAVSPPMAIDVGALNAAFSALAERLSPTVVNIYSTTKVRMRSLGPQFGDDGFDFFFGNPLNNNNGSKVTQALGSGFVVNGQGYIVTNSHVVRALGRNADEVMVKFIGEDGGKGHSAQIVGVDELTDVAVIKLSDPKANLKFAQMGNSDAAKVGEWVLAIGNPYGHSNSVTQGIVSAIGRNLPGARPEFIQTSASINPGNSGGPLFNLYGEVIGINTAIDPRAQGIGFAIPINTAKVVVDQLIEKGRVTRPFLGVAVEDLTADAAKMMNLGDAKGVLVRQVMPGQPAAAAGIKPYDIIKSVDGQAVGTATSLITELERKKIGTTATIEIQRGNESKTFKVKIVEQPDPASMTS